MSNIKKYTKHYIVTSLICFTLVIIFFVLKPAGDIATGDLGFPHPAIVMIAIIAALFWVLCTIFFAIYSTGFSITKLSKKNSSASTIGRDIIIIIIGSVLVLLIYFYFLLF